jgi:hypothetical protein
MATGRTRAPEIGGCDAGYDDNFSANFDPHLQLTIIHTIPEGTLCALRLAIGFAKDLSAKIRLVATEVVPFRLPLEYPMISTQFLRQRQALLVAEAGIDEEAVTIEICLCRDPKTALREFLAPRSLIMLGGKRRWWAPEHRLSKWLARLGHQVIFADSDLSVSRQRKSFVAGPARNH